MTSIPDKTKDVVHAVEHPVETAKALEHEAEVGASARTPAIALAGVGAVVTALFLVLVVVAFAVYFLVR
jgi:hypothetical protein